MERQLIRILHLSDFHVGKDDHGQQVLFEELLDHVQKRASAGQGPDLVVITGEKRFRGVLRFLAFWGRFIGWGHPVARFSRIAHNGSNPPRRASLEEPVTDSWTFSPRAARRFSGCGAGSWAGTTQGCAPLVFAWARPAVCAPPWTLFGGAFSAVFDSLG